MLFGSGGAEDFSGDLLVMAITKTGLESLLHPPVELGDPRCQLTGRDRIDGRAWFRIWPVANFGNIYAKVPRLESGTVFAG